MMTTLEGFTPYPPELIARYREAGYWEDRSLADFFAEVCHRFANRITYVSWMRGQSGWRCTCSSWVCTPATASYYSSRMYRNSSISTLRYKKRASSL